MMNLSDILLQMAVFFATLAGIALVTSTVKILHVYERAVIFSRGRFSRVAGPGPVFIVPLLQDMMRVDLRIQMLEIPSGYVIWQDSTWMTDAARQRI